MKQKIKDIQNYIHKHKLRINVIHSITVPLIDLINVAVIFLIALSLVLIWFRSGMLLAWRDLGLMMYKPSRWFDIVRFMWFDLQSTGFFFPQGMFIPYAGFMALLEYLGLSSLTIQEIVFYSIIVLDGLSMYYLTSTLVTDEGRPMASLLSGLFYMLNPYIMFHVWYRFNLTIWTAPAIPLLLALYIKGLKEKKTAKYSFLICLGSLLFATGLFVNPAEIVVVALTILSYFLFHIICNLKNRTEVTSALKFTAVLVAFLFASNLWWFLPWSLTLEPIYQYHATSVSNLQIFQGLSELYGLPYIFRLTRKDFWNWKPLYSSASLDAIGFTIPLVAFSALLFKPKNKSVLFFAFLSVFGLFLGKGSQPPLGEFSLWLFNHVPLLIVFRNPFEKSGVMVALAYSFLFGVTATSLHRYIVRKRSIQTKLSELFPTHMRRRKALATTLHYLIIFTILGVYVWPMWTGDLFTPDPRTPEGYLGVHVKVPSYYDLADNWLYSQSEDFRVIVVPFPFGRAHTFYSWGHGYSGKEPSWSLFGKPTISMESYIDIVDNMTDAATSHIGVYETDKLWKILSILNVKYILINYDINSTMLALDSPQSYESALNYVLRPDESRTDNLSGRWIVDGYGEISADPENVPPQQGTTSLRVNTTIKDRYWGGAYWGGGVEYKSYQTWDLSNYTFISFWFKIRELEGIRELWVALYDKQWNMKLWLMPIKESTLNTWQKVTLIMNKPDDLHYQPNSSFDASSVIDIRISLISRKEVPTTSTIWWIDTPRAIPVRMHEQQYIVKDRVYGNLVFYKIDENHFISHIYAADQPIFVEGLDEMFVEIERGSFIPGENIVFVKKQLESSALRFLDKGYTDFVSHPDVTFKKVNPTFYKVQVKNASNPFFLVFSETYDPKWNAYINGKQVEEHYIANGYANAWYIRKNGSYEITLEFWPQKLFYYSTITSSIAFITCALYLIQSKIRPRKQARIY